MRDYGRIFDTPKEELPTPGIGQLGSVPVPSIQLTMSVLWALRNTGDADAHAALKVWLIEKKGWPASDVEWIVFTPLAREGGPGLDVDLVSAETDLYTSYDAPLTTIPPGTTRVARTSFYLPGYDVTDRLKSFWEKHAGAPFKVVVEALHVDPAGELVESLGAHTFDEAFRLEEAVAAGKLEATATYNNVAQPELTVSVL